MTVEDLIKELQKIEDKKKEVCYDDEEWGRRKVDAVTIDLSFHDEPVMLKNFWQEEKQWLNGKVKKYLVNVYSI